MCQKKWPFLKTASLYNRIQNYALSEQITYDEEMKYMKVTIFSMPQLPRCTLLAIFRKRELKVQFEIGWVHCCLLSSDVGMPSVSCSIPRAQADIKLGNGMTGKKSFLFYPKQRNN